MPRSASRRYLSHAARKSGAGKTAGFPRWLRRGARTLLHIAGDGGAVLLAYYCAYQARFHWPWFVGLFPISGEAPGWPLYRELMYTIVPLWLILFGYSSRLYTRAWSNPYDRFLRIFKGTILSTLATLIATYIYSRLAYSRLMLLLAGPAAAVLVALSHIVVLRIDRRLASLEKASPLLLIGGGRVSELIRSNIHERHPNAPIHEIDRLPAPKKLLELTAAGGIRDIVLASSDVDHAALLELAETCESADINFRMIPDLLELRLGEVQMDDSLGLPAYRLQHTQLTRTNYVAKRAFDVVFVLALLAALGPPLLLIALIIRLDSAGPALFTQQRVGFHGRPFKALKFRTMVVNAEAALRKVRGRGAHKGGFFKAKSDPRVTRVGRWLRRFSLDEFPQFINVLRGEMSIVGPRPLAVKTGEIDGLIRQFGATAKKRVNTLPGITGLWQVSGRSDLSPEQRFALDMFYIEHWSLGLDLQIILKTIPAMLSGKGAY